MQSNSIVLERGKEYSPAIHQTLQEYCSNELVEVPEPPQNSIPAQVLPNSIGTKIPLTDKVVTTQTELENVTNQIKEREKEQGKKYSFYKSFYNESKEHLKKVKQILNENDKLKTQNQHLKKENNKMSYKIKKFTEEQLENLRQIPLVDVAIKLGLPLVENKNGYARFKTHEYNIVIDEEKNTYIDNVSLKKGFGAINFLKDIVNYDFKQAIDFLGNDFSAHDIAREIKENKNNIDFLNSAVKKQVLELPKEQPLNNKNIVNYLTKTRAIEPQLIQELLDSKRLYADKLNNCVFTNENNNFAYVRGTHAEKDLLPIKDKWTLLNIKTQMNLNKSFI